jgi:hypothetical protein
LATPTARRLDGSCTATRFRSDDGDEIGARVVEARASERGVPMAMHRLVPTFGCATAAAAVLAAMLAPAHRTEAIAGREVLANQAGCASASFNVPRSSPFSLTPRPGGRPGRPRSLVSGSFARRSGADSGCRCDIAVSVASEDNADPDFLMLLRGNPDGSFVQFAEVPSLEVGKNPLAIAAGPFKKDSGGLDSVVVVSSGSTGPGTATIFAPDKNTGAYSKPAAGPTTWQTGAGAIAIATGDFNGDGNLDAAIANRDRTLTLLLGNGAGSFEPKPVPVAGLPGVPSSVTTGHFSGVAGVADIAVAITTDAPRRSAIVLVHGRTFTVDPPVAVGETGSAEPWIATANLSAPQASAAAGRDLVVGYTDFDARQQPIGRIKVLLGNGPGGAPNVASAQTIAVGAKRIRSLVVADLDADGAVDLAASTFGDTGDGTIEFFQGRSSGAVGFHENPAWEDRPATRPRSLAAGRFGPKSGDAASLPHVGLAFVNERVPEAGVFLGSGGGAFAQPDVVTMPIDPKAELFVSGDFHTRHGNDSMRDLAYVTTDSAGRRILTLLASTGAGGFTPRTIGIAGANPRLIATGRFTGTNALEAPTDIAIVDVPASGVPILKIFQGNGSGGFTLVETPLGGGDPPLAIATGPFKGPGTDIAIFRGEMLHLLVNDGPGRFSAGGPPMNVRLRPGTVAASNLFRADGRVHMVVRDATANRFVFLVNIGNGAFRFGTDNDGVAANAGNVDALLLGDVNSDKRVDVVTFDRDMTIRVFTILGEGEGFVAAKPMNPLGERKLSFSLPNYFLEDFGEGRLGLAAAAILNGKPGLAMLHGDGSGGFTATAPGSSALNFTEFDTRLGGPGRSETAFLTDTIVPGLTSDLAVMRGFAHQFRNEQLGNRRPDLAFVSTLRTASFTAGNCPGDTRPPPPNRRPIVCPSAFDFVCEPDEPPRRPGEKPRPCGLRPDADCCNCASVLVNGVRAPACPGMCNTPEPPPLRPFCRTTRERQFIAVYANSCTR